MAGEHIFDATARDFATRVLERSREVPVLVDFWAPWCGPCRVLGPVLEALAEEMDGAFELAKVDQDTSPELAMQYNVRSIPFVLLFQDGQPVDGFVGALPESQVRQFLRPHLRTPADDLLAEGRQALGRDDQDAARQCFEQALALDPGLDAARLELARLALRAGDLDQVEARIAELATGSDELQSGQALLAVLEHVRTANETADRSACVARLESNGDDHQARFALAGHQIAGGDYPGALGSLLEIARRDRHWRNEAARKAMLDVFTLVGTRSELADEYRDRLRALYY